MGLSPSISSYYNYPPNTTGKEQETTKMHNEDFWKELRIQYREYLEKLRKQKEEE